MHKPDLAGKITGMLLEMDNAEPLVLLDSAEELAAKVESAHKVLERAHAKAPPPFKPIFFLLKSPLTNSELAAIRNYYLFSIIERDFRLISDI